MKKLLLLCISLNLSLFLFAQDEGPKEITPQLLQKIKADIENQIPAIKEQLAQKEMTADQIEFSLDTFRIEQIVAKRMEIDYSTAGMINTMNEMTAGYDKVMNKYYNKLLKALKPEDKKVLIAAQKAWLAYRDAEAKLIGIMTKEVYSGGGTIQSILSSDSYTQLVVKRTLEIFNYFDSIIKDK